MKFCAQCNGTFEEGIAYCPKDGSRLTSRSKLSGAGTSIAPPANGAQGEGDASAEDDGVENLTGQTVAGRYKVLRRLGEGGMGVVYSAVDTRLEKEVAIKVLKEDFARRQDVVARFTQEAKSAARIKHENVLDVTDYGQTEAGSFYIAMELLVGTDLADALAKCPGGVLDPVRAVAISIQVTRALQAAHGKGIVHRDLKPENVFLVPGEDNREVVKIVDFGIAQMKDLSGGGSTDSSRKLTRTGMIFGTPEYMSPEQAAGKQIDHRVDVYAVGVIMYEMLAGRVPFVGDTFMGILTQHMFEPVPPISDVRKDAAVPPELEAVVQKALAKDPAQRYASMQEFGDDLARLRDGQRPSAVGAAIGAPPSRPDFTARHGTPTVPGSLTAKFAAQASNTPMDPVSHTIETGTPKGNRGLMVGALVVGLLGIGGGIALAMRPKPEAPVVTTAQPSHPTTPNAHENTAGNGTTGNGNGAGGSEAMGTSPTGAMPGTVIAAPDAGSAVPAPPGLIHVHIVSTPPRARIEVQGANLLCQATPCDLPLTRGQEVHLTASAPRKHGEATVTPQTDGETVTIALEPVAAAPSHDHDRPSANSGGSHPSGGHRGACTNGMRTDPSTGLLVPCFMH